MSKDTKQQSRWKFLVGGAAVSLLVRANSFINGSEPATAQVIGSFFGAILGGVLVGWIVWSVWASAKK
jgi:hypothetical protein